MNSNSKYVANDLTRTYPTEWDIFNKEGINYHLYAITCSIIDYFLILLTERKKERKYFIFIFESESDFKKLLFMSRWSLFITSIIL